MIERIELLREIAREEARLENLKTEVESTKARLSGLRRQLDERVAARSGTDPVPDSTMPVPESNREKVALFRSLFKGREDIFARRWEKPATGKSGYSPACMNEWKRSLCGKAVKSSTGRSWSCGKCPNREFLPVSDEEVAKHFRGDQVIGVYALLPDETCSFLAIDFDKKEWKEDVTAFAETCRSFDLPVAIERSRSGNGAHAWFFFESSIAAKTARNLGCLLISETMNRRPELSMESYDRLFPNQDTMPKGSFGNLIALPLQHDARANNNSVFVDDALTPWPDQWKFLAGIKRIRPESVHSIIADTVGKQQNSLPVPIGYSLGIDDESTLAMKVTEQLPKTKPERMKLPSVVRIVLREGLILPKAGLSSPIINQIKQVAAFQNPEFYKRQNLRLSTARTPRVIVCTEDHQEYIVVPRGCLPQILELLRQHRIEPEIEDERNEGATVGMVFHGTLTPIQEQAAKALLSYDNGVIVMPPGVGKTVIGIYVAAARGRSTLVLVHRKPLLEQWISQLSMFLCLDRREIGQIGGGKAKPNGQLDVAMVQSLVRRDSLSHFLNGYGQVILDEAHHCPAISFERVLSAARAKYFLGLTATPRRRDGLHPILYMQLGPKRFGIDAKSDSAQKLFKHNLVVRETDFRPRDLPQDAGIQQIYSALVRDERRNDLIFDDVLLALEGGRSPILLTERRDHLDHLADRLVHFTRNLIVLHGGMKAKDRNAAIDRLSAIPDNEARLLIATGRFIGEGFDDPRLDTLFLTLPVSWKGTLIQYTGRLHRFYPTKTEVRIYDYVDRAVPMLERMY